MPFHDRIGGGGDSSARFSSIMAKGGWTVVLAELGVDLLESLL